MTRIEALCILKPEGKTLADVRTAYKKAALRYHPDHGGDVRQMQLVNEAFALLTRILEDNKTWSDWHEAKAAQETPLTEVILKKYNQVKHLHGVKIELIGTWLWVTGDTRHHRTQLKGAGFRWNRKKLAWYWHPATYRKRTRREWSLEKIRETFEATTLQTEELLSVA